MSLDVLKIGEETKTGHVVAKIFGQGPLGAVYTSTNNEIRWIYWGNGGLLPDELGIVVARFDALIPKIRSLKDVEDKTTCYELAGKALYLAFHSKSLPDPSIVFSGVEQIITLRSAQSKIDHSDNRYTDIVIVCALHNPELQAILSFCHAHETFHLPGDPQTYHSSRWESANGKALRVVLAAPNQMGLTASGVLAAKMVLQFRPKLVAMSGIAAGTKYGKQGFGDIVAPEHTFDYGAGKSIKINKRQDIVPSPQPLSIQARLLGRIKEWERSRKMLDEISNGWKSARPRTMLQIHTGPIFSAPTVQQTNVNVEKLISQWRKLSAVEMEAYAVHRACNDTIEPAPMYFCAKSICDFASGKNDDWQHYAAYTSASFVYSFISREWDVLFPS